jgi:hypothetical protein
MWSCPNTISYGLFSYSELHAENAFAPSNAFDSVKKGLVLTA